MAAYRPEFLEALNLLSEAFEDVVRAGFKRPVLVGGAAVEFYSGGAVVSGDFDVITDAQDVLEEALLRRGFRRPSGTGMLLRGLFHPLLKIGVEVVSGRLFDGAADETRIRLLSLSGGAVAMPAVEDMIADRMGQFCANPQGHRDMLDQAIVLYRIASLEAGLDRGYLEKRIRDETVNSYDLQFLAQKADATDHP